MPNKLQDKTKCSKCPNENWKICDIFSNNCIKCKNNYRANIDIKSGLIKSCDLLCDLGEGDKCLTCEMKKGKESLCSSCNEGYKLINGKCKKIENSFIGIYNITSTSNPTKIMNFQEKHINLSDFDMYINGSKVQARSKIGYKLNYYYIYDIIYQFPNLGKYEVKIIFNKTLTSMSKLFENCYNLISVDFSETFDSSHVICLVIVKIWNI